MQRELTDSQSHQPQVTRTPSNQNPQIYQSTLQRDLTQPTPQKTQQQQQPPQNPQIQVLQQPMPRQPSPPQVRKKKKRKYKELNSWIWKTKF